MNWLLYAVFFYILFTVWFILIQVHFWKNSLQIIQIYDIENICIRLQKKKSFLSVEFNSLLSWVWCCCSFVFVALEIRASHILPKSFTTELSPHHQLGYTFKLESSVKPGFYFINYDHLIVYSILAHIEFQTVFNFGTGDQVQVFAHAEHKRYHWANPPALRMSVLL